MKRILLFISFSILSLVSSFGQCAMCRATLETKVGQDNYVGVGAGINAGVLYLMVVPYLLLVFVVLLYRYKKKQALKV